MAVDALQVGLPYVLYYIWIKYVLYECVWLVKIRIEVSNIKYLEQIFEICISKYKYQYSSNKLSKLSFSSVWVLVNSKFIDGTYEELKLIPTL